MYSMSYTSYIHGLSAVSQNINLPTCDYFFDRIFYHRADPEAAGSLLLTLISSFIIRYSTQNGLFFRPSWLYL